MEVHIDGVTGPNGIEGLSAQMERASRQSPGEVRKTAQGSAARIKKGWQDRWSGHRKIRMLPNTVTYDTRQTGDKVIAEIGPEHGRRGAQLANLIEYEFGGVHSAPIPGGAPALEEEQPRFEKALSDLEVRLLEGRR
jgi:hypothetical protein